MPDALIGALTILCVAGLACLPLWAVYGGGVDWTRAAVAAWEGGGRARGVSDDGENCAR